jgi:hypothetical protein
LYRLQAAIPQNAEAVECLPNKDRRQIYLAAKTFGSAKHVTIEKYPQVENVYLCDLNSLNCPACGGTKTTKTENA